MSIAGQLSSALEEAAPLKTADFQGKLSDKQRSKLIRAIMAKTHRDYRSTKGDSTHPSVLVNMGGKGTGLVPLQTAPDDDLRAIAKDKKVLSEAVTRRAVIGAKGLEKPGGDKLSVLPNRVYWLGASTSPKMIFVTGVSGDKVTYKSYPFEQGSDHVIELWIARDLIAKGTTTHLKTYGKYMTPRLKKSLEDMLVGGEGSPEKLKDYMRVEVTVTAAPGITGDLWREAERYGSVGGIEKDGVYHYAITTDNMTLAELKKDKQFKIVSTKDL